MSNAKLHSLGITWLSSCVFFFLFFQLDLGAVASYSFVPSRATWCNSIVAPARVQQHCQVSDLSFLWSPVNVPTNTSRLKSLILVGSFSTHAFALLLFLAGPLFLTVRVFLSLDMDPNSRRKKPSSKLLKRTHRSWCISVLGAGRNATKCKGKKKIEHVIEHLTLLFSYASVSHAWRCLVSLQTFLCL